MRLQAYFSAESVTNTQKTFSNIEPRPDWQDRGPLTDSERIDDEINRQVALCTCKQKFKVFQVGEGKYRVSYLFFNYLSRLLKAQRHSVTIIKVSLSLQLTLQS